MATNDIHVTVSDNNVSAPLTVSGGTSLRSVSTDSGSPYYVGARAYVTQTENGATITIIDREGTTTATVLNGTNGVDGRDGVDGVDGVDGIDGVDGVGITSITQNVDGTLTILLDDGSSYITEPLKGEDGQDGQDGADGFSPIASVSKVGDTATISITDINGTTTASISDGTDGADGQDGADGADGYSPTATVTKSGDTATISITDKNGTTTATVSDGASGTSAFEAEFGITTYADVKDAYDDDEILICTVPDGDNTMTLQLVYFDVANEMFYFAFPMSDGWYWTQISNEEGWDDGTWYFASTDVATQLRDGLMSALDKQKLDGLSKRNIWYGTCSTSANSSPKAITTASGDFELTTGSMLCVLFSHTNSLSSVSLQVDGGTSKSAYSMDGTSDIANRWGSGEVVMFAYDGTKFILLEQGKASTTAYGITKLNNTTTSTSTSEAATANAVKAAYDLADGKYTKPSTGIPKTDLASAVQTSLGLADTALQSFTETDPTVPSWAKASTKPTYTASEVGAQETLVSGTNIKTINNTSLLGSGDITVASSGTSVPTADEVAEFDSTAHMNSTDMTASEVSDFVDSLEAQGGSPQKTAFTPTTGSAYSPWGGCYYIKLGHIVNLHLGISGLTAGTGNNVYTLPSEVRPSAQISAAGVGGAVTQVSPVIITSDGGITVYPQGNTYCTLDVTYIV